MTRLSSPLCDIQEADSGRLELAVRSAVVLARMKAHQKAQLARLLAKGLQVTDDRYLKVRLSPLHSDQFYLQGLRIKVETQYG